MSKFPELFPGVRLGPQPTDEDVAELKGLGVRSVIDFRKPGETQTPNAALFARHQLAYTNIPIARDNPEPGAAERLDQAMQAHPGPYLLHCGSGIRAITVFLIREAQQQGWSAERAEQEAKERGYDLSSAPALQQLVYDSLRH